MSSVTFPRIDTAWIAKFDTFLNLANIFCRIFKGVKSCQCVAEPHVSTLMINGFLLRKFKDIKKYLDTMTDNDFLNEHERVVFKYQNNLESIFWRDEGLFNDRNNEGHLNESSNRAKNTMLVCEPSISETSFFMNKKTKMVSTGSQTDFHVLTEVDEQLMKQFEAIEKGLQSFEMYMFNVRLMTFQNVEESISSVFKFMILKKLKSLQILFNKIETQQGWNNADEYKNSDDNN